MPEKKKLVIYSCILFLILGIFFFKSPKPFFWNLYSSPYFSVLFSISIVVVFILVIVKKFRGRAFYIISASLLTLIVFLVVIEVGGRLYAYLHSGYKVLALYPDKKIGWKFAPNTEHIFTGNHWYAREFSVPIKINSLGFRDKERSIQKLPDTIRIALIGDSHIAARQVELDKTVGQLLEAKLNKRLSPKTGKHYEVLNFGVGAFGIGQSFLTYEYYAKIFKPDYTALMVFDYLFWRTTGSYKSSSSKIFPNLVLGIRPAFFWKFSELNIIDQILNIPEFHAIIETVKKRTVKKESFPWKRNEYEKIVRGITNSLSRKKVLKVSKNLEKASIYFYKPLDYKQFVKTQAEVIKKEYGGKRSKERKQKFFLRDIFKSLDKNLRISQKKLNDPMYLEMESLKMYFPEAPYQFIGKTQRSYGNKNFLKFEHVILANIKLLNILNQAVKLDGGEFVLADATNNIINRGFLPANITNKLLNEFSKINQWNYIPLGDLWNQANAHGISTRFAIDGHINEEGHRIYADALFKFFEPLLNLPSNQSTRKNL